MGCNWCDNTGWELLDEEEGVGFVYGNCRKCCWPRWLEPIPAPVDALAFVSERKRIMLGEEREWQMHGPAW